LVLGGRDPDGPHQFGG